MMKRLFLVVLWVIVCCIPTPAFGQWQMQIIDPSLPSAATVHTGDIDGDKDPDVVASSFGDGKVVWYGNDLPSQVWGAHMIDDNLPGVWGVQVADIDNDNKMDVVAAGSNVHDVVWYKNEGGRPIEWTKITIDSNVFAQTVYVADIDNDKDPDVIVTAIDAPHIICFENNNLVWTKRTIGDLDGAACLELHDMDGDLDLDIVATSFLEFKVFWFENNLSNHNWPRHTIDNFLPGAWGVGVADFDGDNDPDVVATSLISDDVVWYENHRPDLPWKEHTIDANLEGARYLSVVDMDIDKDFDLVVSGDESEAMVWYENDLPEDTVWTRNIIDGNLNGANYVSAADMNGDTHPDLIVTGWYENRVIWYENIITDIGIVSGKMPTRYLLSQNYPNPFNPSTTIKYSVPKTSQVELTVYNALGQLVRVLVNDYQTSGEHAVVWDGKDDNGNALSSGNYFYQIKMGEFISVKKVTYLK